MSADWDTFVKAWALVGPILTAATAQIWTRRSALQDREFERSQEESRERRAAESNRLEWERDVGLREKAEKKDAYAAFMSSTHEYVRKQSEAIDNVNRAAAASEANDDMVRSCQLVVLLGPAHVAEAAIDFWNCTLEVPKSFNVPSTSDDETKQAAYRAARAKFNQAARTDLHGVTDLSA